jgi:hypothetical protein
MQIKIPLLFRTTIFIVCSAIASSSFSFCGFYVAKADAKLFNNKSEVIMVRDGIHNVITMSSDFQGSLEDFAMVVPVPVVIDAKNVRVIERRIFDVLNDYSAPRLVNYYDQNPCGQPQLYFDDMNFSMVEEVTTKRIALCSSNEMDYGVTIEAEYEVDEYKIMILSAKESDGLKNWLIANKYKIPDTAADVLDPYIKSNMKFFLVKVNLQKKKSGPEEFLRPIQITFDHDKFMLPLRLGMANSQGSQDMIVYAFTRKGRVECTNYRTVKMPTDRNIPLYVQPKFGDFYKSLFEKTYLHEGRNAVFLEYAWNVSPYNSMHCDPCVGPPPVNRDFVDAGVDWLEDPNAPQQDIFFTRLHVRYTRDKFPADLQFQVTPNSEMFQCRYVMTYPAGGDLSCEAGQTYLVDLFNRRKKEVDELSALTGWNEKEGKPYIDEFSGQIVPAKSEEKKNEFIPFSIIQHHRLKLLLVLGLLFGTLFLLKISRPKKAITTSF